MAINSLDISCDEINPKSQCIYNCYKPHSLPASRLVKIDFATEGSICSSISKQGKLKKNYDRKSPYLSGDNGNVLSSGTEKRFVQRKGTNMISSFPMVASLYKASSDQFKAAKNKKKVKKSVLTLPTDAHAPTPQSCTVSDMNDSEYCHKDNACRKKGKKRNTTISTKARGRGRDFEFYDRDAQYCSQMNIDLDCSSTDMLKNYNGDGKCISKSIIGSNGNLEENVNPHDVWAVLRNINRFQFTPSPPISEDSFIKPKKKKGPKRRNNRKDMRLVETCHTEEFAYISSSYNLDSKSPRSFSPDSSFDRVTVIDKKDDYSKMCKDFEENIVKATNLAKSTNNSKGKQLFNRTYHRTVNNNNTKLCLPDKLKDNISNVNRSENVCGDTTLVTYQNNKLRENNQSTEECDNRTQEYSRGSIQTISCDKFIYQSGSSKALIVDDKSNKNRKVSDKDKSLKKPISVNCEEMSGIRKVVLNRSFNGVPPSKPEPLKQYPRESTNSSIIVPRVTKADIKRRLSKQRFPIVILGKDEISDSAFEVINEEPPQYNGLNKQIWPFMVGWHKSDNTTNENSLQVQTNHTSQYSHKRKSKHEGVEKAIPSKIKIIPGKQSKSKDRKPGGDIKFHNKTKVEPKLTFSTDMVTHVKRHETRRPIQKLKDRMLKLLYKNSSVQNVADQSTQIGYLDNAKKDNISSMKKVDAYNDSKLHIKNTRRTIASPKQKQLLSDEPRSWSKAKWTSALIENVIRKIKNGIYYTNDTKVSSQQSDVDFKEAEIQTISPCKNIAKAMHTNSKLAVKNKYDLDISIPGFDNVLPAFEIKTMNTNEIAVRHCVTNIIVCFDVIIPTMPELKTKQTTTLVPLTMTENDTKIYKCKTSILNAILPAELCTILPKMINKIIELGDQFSPASTLFPELSTISEVTVNESRETFEYCLIPPMSLETRRLLSGRYLNADKISPKLQILGKTVLILKYESRLVEELMPHLSIRNLFDWVVKPTEWIPINNCKVEESNYTINANYRIPILAKPKDSFKTTFAFSKPMNTCTAVIPYVESDQKLFSEFRAVNTLSLVENMALFVNAGPKKINLLINNVISINLTMTDSLRVHGNTVRISSGNFVMDIPFQMCMNELKSIKKYSFSTNKAIIAPSTRGEHLNTSFNNIKKKILQSHVAINNVKIKRKGFRGKAFKRLKAYSKMSDEKVTSLSKVTNVDEFFHALGAAKILSSVFDSISGHKIMSCIAEMKNWTTGISPKQALLVLLLTNKKDTPNLLRYRSVLLQGISVNRITSVSDLDMEIEVIEKEQLNRIYQHEGISYLPALAESQDSLFEELYWIAKTTASHYQRSFDETSAKLLKSLMEKRKKLNPSYLRVMARYVGLGLLKSPGKK